MTDAERELLSTTAYTLFELLKVLERPAAFGPVMDPDEARRLRDQLGHARAKLPAPPPEE